MRTRNADSSKSTTPKRTPPSRKSATKTAADSSAANRSAPPRTRLMRKKDASPSPNPNNDSKSIQSPEQLKSSAAAATTTTSVKKRASGRLRAKPVATPNLEERLVAAVDEIPTVDNFEADEKMEEPQDVELVGGHTVTSQEPAEQDIWFVGQSEEKEQKTMEVDGTVVGNVYESEDMGEKIVNIEVTASEDAAISFKQPESNIIDLKVSVDCEYSTAPKEGEKGMEEFNEQEGEKAIEEFNEQGREKAIEVFNEQEGEKAMEEFNEQEREKAMEEFNEQEGEKGMDEFKEQEGDKEEAEIKEWEGEKGVEEFKEQEGEKGAEEFKELEGEKGKEELKEQDVWKGKEGLKDEQEGEKGKEEVKEQEGEKRKEELKEVKEEEMNIITHKEQCSTVSFSEGVKDQLQKDKEFDEGMKSSEKLDFGEQDGEDFIEEDPEEPPEEPEAFGEQHIEYEAIAKQRKINKEHEIFVGGLDRDTTEDDLRKVFERIGEVVEVRLNKFFSTNKNKGYAFVKFANKEHAKKALSEMKNPVIHGKRCGTAPCEDNDTLFLGNICNTWTKEAVKQKLIDYGIEGVENITLVPDVQHEGLSRGFAFIEFSGYAEAMLAYKRLQKPDAIFGHAERTAKVAFAEPIHEPDPETMAQVKSVFINGLPPHWDENHVRELLKSYGEIVKIVLARNMSTAKRKDYGFVDFSTHEAAVACVDGVNKSELGDGASKIKLRARLSNPLPKTQTVKGGMCGGLRIGHARTGAFPRPGRGSGRGRQPFNNWGNFNRDRNFYRGRGGYSQFGRMGSRDDRDFNMHPDFHHRQFGAVRGGRYAGSRGAAFVRPSRHHDRPWYGIPDGGAREPIPMRRPYSPGGEPIPMRRPYSPGGEPIPMRRPYSPSGQFDRSFMGWHFDDPYLHDDNLHGVKRPFYMTEPEPDYMGRSRPRPRLDYADPALFRGNRNQDPFGEASTQYPHDHYHYGSDHGGGPYSSFYEGDSSHGHGYYY